VEVPYKPRAQQKDEEHRIAMEIHDKPLPLSEKIVLWKSKTGLSQTAYYRALERNT
jgi:hypothetical protein